MSDRQSVKVVHAALDESESNGDIILRGVVEPDSLQLLQVADYQREIAPRARISDLATAFKEGSVPDVELGMRGQDFMSRSEVFFLYDSVFIIDGLQRITAAQFAMTQGLVEKPRIGAAIHFDTTEEWERKRFKILNVDRQALSPNVILRNMRKDHGVVLMLHRLTLDRGFILYRRVSWNQRMKRSELLTALTFAKTAGYLHRRFGPGLSNQVATLVQGLEKTRALVGSNVFRDNVKTLFTVVDKCWGIRRITFREGAVYLKTTFLRAIADLFVRHSVFWNESKRLEVPKDVLHKLANFPIMDPHVKDLASGGSVAGARLLYELVLEHVNKGKRSRRLESDFQ